MNEQPLLLEQALLLLETVQEEADVHTTVDALMTAGLRLMPALVLTMARQHHPHMSSVIHSLCCKDKAALLAGCDPTPTGDPALTNPNCLMAVVAMYPSWLSGLPQVQTVLRAAPREVLHKLMPDLLRVACNNKKPHAAELLLETLMPVLEGNGAGTHRLSDSDVRALVLELLESCAVRRHSKVAWALGQLPVMRQLGCSEVLRLVKLDIMHAPQFDDQAGNKTFEPEAVCLRLPASVDLTPEAVAQAMQLCIDLGRTYLCRHLCGLRAAKDMASGQLCKLILSAMRANNALLAGDIAKLAHGRVLDGPDAVALTVACLKLGRDQNAESWLRLLRKRLDLPRHLSAADAVALVQQVAADKALHDFLSQLSDFVLVRASDTQGVFEALKSMLQLGTTDRPSFQAIAVQLLAPEQQLQPSHCFELLQCSLAANGKLPEIPYNWQPMQQLDEAQVQQLLQLAVVKSAADAAGTVLASAPAAAGVQLPLLAELLQLVVSQSNDDPFTLRALLQLPAAQQVDEPALRQVLDAAVAAGHGSQVLHLLAVLHECGSSTAADLNSSRLEQLLMAMCKDRCADPEVVVQLLQHSSAEGMSAAGTATIALAYMTVTGRQHSGWWSPRPREAPHWVAPVQQLLRLPGMRQLPCAETMLQLLRACMMDFDCHELRGWAALPAAQHLTGDHIQELLRASTYRPSAVQGWHVVLELPACQQLTEEAIAELFAACVRNERDTQAACVANAELLLQLPAAQRLSGKTIAKLVERLLSVSAPVFGPLHALLQLPAAQQLTVQQVKPWVKQALTASNAVCDSHASRAIWRRGVHAALMQLPCLSTDAADIEDADEVELLWCLHALQA